LIPSILIRKPPLHPHQAPEFMFAHGAVDFMITGKAPELMMAQSTLWAMELPMFFDVGGHLSLLDCHLPQMGYQAGSVQPSTNFYHR